MKNSEIGVNLNTDLFTSTVNKFVSEENVKCIIECGTNNGMGSSEVFAKTGVRLLTCEANRRFFEEASLFLKKYKNVKCHHSFTTKSADSDLIYSDFLERTGFAPNSENWLEKTFKREYNKLNEGESILVFLDSHWTIGFIEFRKIFDYWWHKTKPLKNKIILILDDVTNLKHRPAIRYLESHKLENHILLRKERWAVLKFE